MILHIPHSSRELGGHVELSNELRNLSYLTDTDVDMIFDDGVPIKFPFSRFVCDVERLKVNEPMDSKGQGIIYRKDCYGNGIIRHISDEDVYKMYDEHHRKLTLMINKQLAYIEHVVIVDCHSFPPDIAEDVDVCIGTDDIHTPVELVDLVVTHLLEKGVSVKINEPYGGTMVPEHHKDNPLVQSIMIDVNKKLYVNNMYEFKPIITELLEKINEYEGNIA